MALPPGVPALLNGTNAFFGTFISAGALVNQIAALFDGNKQSAWGLYENGANEVALQVDGFVEFSLSNASQIAGYRIEKGQFASYNKVDSPYELSLVAVKRGTILELDDFLFKLDVISNDIKLYNILTPGQLYQNANMQQYAYRRSIEGGLNLLYVSMMFTQILSTDEAQFNVPTKTPAGQKIENNGTVTTQPLAPQTNIIANPL